MFQGVARKPVFDIFCRMRGLFENNKVISIHWMCKKWHNVIMRIWCTSWLYYQKIQEEYPMSSWMKLINMMYSMSSLGVEEVDITWKYLGLPVHFFAPTWMHNGKLKVKLACPEKMKGYNCIWWADAQENQPWVVVLQKYQQTCFLGVLNLTLNVDSFDIPCSIQAGFV